MEVDRWKLLGYADALAEAGIAVDEGADGAGASPGSGTRRG